MSKFVIFHKAYASNEENIVNLDNVTDIKMDEDTERVRVDFTAGGYLYIAEDMYEVKEILYHANSLMSDER